MATAKEAKTTENIPTIEEIIGARKLSSTGYHTVKWIAITAMLFHHIAECLHWFDAISDTQYTACFAVGRIAFPLFCFLIIECFYYTKSRVKHLIKLGILAVISEIPYDVFCTKEWFNFEEQNVILTLFLGFVMVWIIDRFVPFFLKKALPIFNQNGTFITVCKYILSAEICHLFCIASFYLRTEGGISGLVLMYFLWVARNVKHRYFFTVIGLLFYIIYNIIDVSTLYIFTVLAIPIMFIAGRKKKENGRKYLVGFGFLNRKPFKVIASVFYPAHLFILGYIHYFFVV